MTKLLQKARGLLGVGITWGTLWAGIGAGIGFVIGLVRPEVWQWTNPIFEWAAGMGLYGLVSGIGFGTLLTLREGRKTLSDLSIRRTAVWGLIGGAVVPILFGAAGLFPAGTTQLDILGAIGVTGFLGGTFASTSVAIAKRAELTSGGESKGLGSGPDAGPTLLGS
jgi:hypothetical protein